jgi:heme oxygenase
LPQAFEADLAFYLGPRWKSLVTPSLPVAQYIDHLRSLEKDRPALLLVYAYHMYMAILSGGQILKRVTARALALPPGEQEEGHAKGMIRMMTLSVPVMRFLCICHHTFTAG